MAVTLTDQWQTLTSGSFSYTYSGLSYSMTTAVDGYAVQASSTTATVWLRGWIGNTGSNGWTGTNKVYRISVTNSGGTTVYDSGQTTDSETLLAGSSHHVPSSVGSACFTGTSGATYRVTFYYNIPVGGGTTISQDVIVPTYATPPTGLTASNVSSTTNSFTATVSVSGWGTGGSATASDYYKTLRIHAYTDSGLSDTFRYTRAYGTSTSSNITVNNSSALYSGSLTLSANTRYVMSVFASNGTLDTGAIRIGAVYTIPNTPSVAETGSQSYNTYNRINCPVQISVPADGGALTKTIQYRYKKGSGSWSSWANTNVGTISGSSATTKTFTPVFDAGSTYTLEVRSTTSAGSSASGSCTITTKAAHQAPDIGAWEFEDTNTSVIELLGTADYLAQGVSTPRMRINVNNLTLYDSVSVSSVTGTFAGSTISLSRSGDYYVNTFSSVSQSGDLAATLTVKDSLQASSSSNKTMTVLPYRVPTLELSYERSDETGKSSVSCVGNYGALAIDDVDKNDLTGSYRVSSTEGVVVDWTSAVVIKGEKESGFRDYSILLENLPTDYAGTFLVEVRVQDAFNTTQSSIVISQFSDEQVLKMTQWDIEIWSRNGVFKADVSRFLQNDLNITWALNDVESVSFDLSLDAIEQLKLQDIPVSQIFIPYAYDVRIRRNGKYVIGCNIVEANISIQNSSIPLLKMKGTGYLNLFKDRYISRPLSKYKYPRMAQKLIHIAQEPDYLIKNPTGDIDASYWISPMASIAQTTASHSGGGAIQCVYSTTGWRGMGTQMRVPAGTQIKVDFWAQGQGGVQLAVRERQLINQSSGQGTIARLTPSSSGVYQHFTTGTYTTQFDNGYIYFEQEQTTNTTIRLDDVFVYRVDDEASLNNQYVQGLYTSTDDTAGGAGHDYTSSSAYTDQEYDYDLQNVKDAIIDLTTLGEPFEFAFTPDKIFNVYSRKGTDKPELELSYPGNVSSLEVSRTAQNLANKIQMIGSGIGDERLEAWAMDTDSRTLYGTHESVVTESNISLQSTLQAKADSELEERAVPTCDLKVTINDGSLNCGNVETGDTLPFRVNLYEGVLAQQTPINATPLEGTYRVTTEINGQKMALAAINEQCTQGSGAKCCFMPFDSTDPLQQWEIVSTGQSPANGPYYQLENCGIPRESTPTCRALDVPGATFTDQRPIQCWSKNGTVAQKWTIQFNVGEPDKVMLKCYGDNYYLDYNPDTMEAVLGAGLSLTLQKIDAPTELSLLKSVEGWYRIKQLTAKVDKGGVESLELTLNYEGGL